MGQELSDRVAIVTGGAAGIGRATAELFVQEGARVVIADVDAARGEAVAADLGDSAVFKRTDVVIADEVQALVDFAVARFGDCTSCSTTPASAARSSVFSTTT